MPIRAARLEDIPAILEIYRPYVENTTYSFEYTVPSLEEFTVRFVEHTRQFPWLVWEEEGAVLGYAYAGAAWERAAYQWTAEISIYLHSSLHGRGVGKALYRQVEQCLKAQGYRIVYALVTTENTGSLAFHQHMGYTHRTTFEHCGYKMGRWLGVVWLEKQLMPLGEPDAPPVPWQCVFK